MPFRRSFSTILSVLLILAFAAALCSRAARRRCRPSLNGKRKRGPSWTRPKRLYAKKQYDQAAKRLRPS